MHSASTSYFVFHNPAQLACSSKPWKAAHVVAEGSLVARQGQHIQAAGTPWAGHHQGSHTPEPDACSAFIHNTHA